MINTNKIYKKLIKSLLALFTSIKNLIKSLLILCASLCFFSIVSLIGGVMAPFVYFFDENKTFLGFFMYIIKIFSGVFNSISYIIHSFAVGYDIFCNAIAGDSIEFTITPQRDTMLGNGKNTVSAGIGDVSKDKELNLFGKCINKGLNIVFNQEDHGRDARKRYLLIKEYDESIKKRK